MLYERREYPEFSWSYSRSTKFRECPRDYYYHYYASHNGWELEAPEPASLAYRLKNLTSLPLETGAAVHEGAAAAIHRARMGGPAFTYDDFYSLARARLNKAWRDSRDYAGWVLSPKQRRMFHEIYYGRGMADNAIEKAKRQLAACFQSLMESQSYREAVAAPICEVKGVEEFITFDIDGTPIHAVPDLIYRRGDGVWMVIDWKSGQNKGDDTVQAMVYALHVRERFGVLAEDIPVEDIPAENIPAENIRVRVEYLFLGVSEEYDFTDDILDQKADDIRDSIAAMQGYLKDAARNEPLDKDRFPMRDDTSLCRYCNFYQLDRAEIDNTRQGPF